MRAWCTTANLCLSENPLQETVMYLTLSKALKGSVSHWLAQVTFVDYTWPDIKSLFSTSYDCIDPSAAIFVKITNSNSKAGEFYAAYAARLMSILTSS